MCCKIFSYSHELTLSKVFAVGKGFYTKLFI